MADDVSHTWLQIWSMSWYVEHNWSTSMNDDVSTDIDFSDDIADSENVLYKQHQESLEKNDVNTPIIDEVVNTDSIKQPKKMIIDYLDKDEMDQKIHQIHSLTEDFIIALDHKNAARIVGSSKSMTPTLFQAPSQFFLQTLDTSKTSLFFQQRKSILIELIQKKWSTTIPAYRRWSI